MFVYRGVDYSSSWTMSFHDAREFISKRLHILHPTHLEFLDLCQHTYGTDVNIRCIGDILMIDFRKLRAAGPLDQHQLRNNVTIELEKSQEFLKNIWFTNFINIFVDKNRLKSIPNSQMNSFYNSVTVLASNQVNLVFFGINKFFFSILFV